MTIKKAIEILRGYFECGSTEELEAGKMAISALEKQEGKKPFPDNDISILACHYCGSGEYLHNADENRNLFCGQCGQRIDWSDKHGTD